MFQQFQYIYAIYKKKIHKWNNTNDYSEHTFLNVMNNHDVLFNVSTEREIKWILILFKLEVGGILLRWILIANRKVLLIYYLYLNIKGKLKNSYCRWVKCISMMSRFQLNVYFIDNTSNCWPTWHILLVACRPRHCIEHTWQPILSIAICTPLSWDCVPQLVSFVC